MPRLRFAGKAGQAVRVARERIREHLEGDLAIEFRVARSKDLPHLSFAQFGEDFVDANLSTLLKVALSLSRGKTRAWCEGRWCDGQKVA